MENIVMRYYLKKGFPQPVETELDLNPEVVTEHDYRNGKFVEITEQQADFYKQNPHASFSEIINMEIIPPPQPVEIPIEIRYKILVVSKIRAVYDNDDEHAITRKKDVEPDEFAEYNDFCEQCKIEAKQELGLI